MMSKPLPNFLKSTLLATFILILIGQIAHAQPTYSYNPGLIGNNTYPFNTTAGNRIQWLYKPSYILPTSPAGLITKIYFLAAGAGTACTYTNFSISIGNTALTTLTSGPWNTGLTTVYSGTTVNTPATASGGWMMFTLQTPFYWNGTSNFVVEVTQSAYTGTGINLAQGSPGGNNRMYGLYGSAASTGADGTCAGFGFDLITVNPPTFTATPNPVCTGGTTTLAATSTYTNPIFLMYKGTSYIGTNPTLVLSNVTAADAGTYSARVVNGPDTSIHQPLTLTVSAPTTISLGTITQPTHCTQSNGSIQINGLSASSAYSVNYKKNNVAQPIINIITNAGGSYTIPNLGVGVYDSIQLRSTPGGCYTIYLGPVLLTFPALPTTTPVTYCQYDVAIPLSAVGTNLGWFDSLNQVNPTGAPTPSTQTPGTKTYYVWQSSNGCTSGKAPLVVTVKPKPAAPTGATTVMYCQYDTPSPLSATGTNIKWYNVPTGGLPLGAAPTPGTFIPGTYSWYASQTNNGCESDRQTFTVIVKPKPAPPTLTNPLRYCVGDAAAPLSATIFGQNLKFYEGPTGGLGSPLSPIPYTGYDTTLTWWVTQTVNGCESDRSRQDVIIHYKPYGVIVTEKPFVCQYQTLKMWYYGNNSDTTLSIDWKLPLMKATLVSQIGWDTIIVRFDTAGMIPVRMQPNNHICAGPEQTEYIDVHPVPIVRIKAANDVCINEVQMITLDYATPNITNFKWEFGGGTKIYGGDSTGGPYGIKWPAPGVYYVNVIVTAGECPSPKYWDTIRVHDLPLAAMVVSKGDICAGDSTHFSAVTKQNGGNIYWWKPNTFFNNGQGADTLADEVWGVVTNRQFVYLTVANQYGCKASDSLWINADPCCDLYLPSGFTPNGDGKNDVFRIITNGHQKISMFRVQDRYGRTVYETADEPRGWDGTSGGKPQETGTYFYYVKYQCQNQQYYEKTGDVTLIR